MTGRAPGLSGDLTKAYLLELVAAVGTWSQVGALAIEIQAVETAVAVVIAVAIAAAEVIAVAVAIVVGVEAEKIGIVTVVVTDVVATVAAGAVDVGTVDAFAVVHDSADDAVATSSKAAKNWNYEKIFGRLRTPDRARKREPVV